MIEREVGKNDKNDKKSCLTKTNHVEIKKIIGYITIEIINKMSSRGKLSIGIFSPKYRDQGLGTESITLLINFSFFTLNLLSLELNVFTNNQRAINCYKKLGFKPIGIRRKADYVDGELIDDLTMDLLISEWSDPTSN
jgi:RimJ/RimL family protein N-acetyltransferase